ncbi:MAG: NAD(P)-dependent oxidoreductase [Faecalibacillus sp.]
MNLLITGAWHDAKHYIKRIEDMGHSVSFLQYEKDTLPCDYEWVEGIIGNGIFLHHSIDQFTNLKFIQLTSAGYDRVPMEYVKKHNIEIYNAKDVYSIPMAEFALSGVLQLYKQSSFFYENQKSHQWLKHRGLLELYGKTVCIVGCGSVGTECAKRFKAFGCQVIGVDVFTRDDVNYDGIYLIDELNNVLSRVDILILTLPLTSKTRHLINSNNLNLLNNAVLVNISRGQIVDTDALEVALDHHLLGAVIDVFEEEPLSQDSFLWNKDNVIITPHNSFVGEGNDKRLNDIISKQLERV